jgi:hypothetical protein
MAARTPSSSLRAMAARMAVISFVVAASIQ